MGQIPVVKPWSGVRTSLIWTQINSQLTPRLDPIDTESSCQLKFVPKHKVTNFSFAQATFAKNSIFFIIFLTLLDTGWADSPAPAGSRTWGSWSWCCWSRCGGSARSPGSSTWPGAWGKRAAGTPAPTLTTSPVQYSTVQYSTVLSSQNFKVSKVRFSYPKI